MCVRVETINDLPFHNPLKASDANFSEETTSLDALQIMNFIATFDGVATIELPTPTSDNELPERYYDVNASRTVTSLDALIIINFLGQQANSSQPEQELTRPRELPAVAPLTATDPGIDHDRDQLVSTMHDGALLGFVAETRESMAAKLPTDAMFVEEDKDGDEEDDDRACELHCHHDAIFPRLLSQR